MAGKVSMHPKRSLWSGAWRNGAEVQLLKSTKTHRDLAETSSSLYTRARRRVERDLLVSLLEPVCTACMNECSKLACVHDWLKL